MMTKSFKRYAIGSIAAVVAGGAFVAAGSCTDPAVLPADFDPGKEYSIEVESGRWWKKADEFKGTAVVDPQRPGYFKVTVTKLGVCRNEEAIAGKCSEHLLTGGDRKADGPPRMGQENAGPRWKHAAKGLTVGATISIPFSCSKAMQIVTVDPYPPPPPRCNTSNGLGF